MSLSSLCRVSLLAMNKYNLKNTAVLLQDKKKLKKLKAKKMHLLIFVKFSF